MANNQDINNIDRSREAIKRRIAMLDAKNAKTAEEIGKFLKEQVELGVALTRLDVIDAVLACFANLVRLTPHETGRLRAGWQFTGDVSDIEFKPGKSRAEIDRALKTAIRNSIYSADDALFVFNNVEYLLALNAGWSKKQAGNFIDLFLQELKSELQKAANGRAA